MINIVLSITLILLTFSQSINMDVYGNYPNTQLQVWYTVSSEVDKIDLTYQLAEFKTNEGVSFLEFLKQDKDSNSVKVIDRLVLKPKKFHSEYRYCRFNDEWDPEIFALFSLDDLDRSPLINPILVVRANRKKEKLEIVPSDGIECPNRSE